MPARKKKKPEKPIFDSIRKPTAPPSVKFGSGTRAEEKVHPAGRKIKHKKPDVEEKE